MAVVLVSDLSSTAAEPLVDVFERDARVLSSRDGQVPLGFVEWPAVASQVDRAAELIDRLIMMVPDDVQGDVDVDLQIMRVELRILGLRLAERGRGL